MIIEPGISTLMKLDNIDSKYTLVIAVAKRAREIAYQGEEPLVNKKTNKPISIAVKEIEKGYIDIIRAEDKPKTELGQALSELFPNKG